MGRDQVDFFVAAPGAIGHGRGRFGQIDLKATALAGLVLITTLIVAWLVEVARGHNGSPYTWLLAVTGAAYILAVAFFRWRGLCLASGSEIIPSPLTRTRTRDYAGSIGCHKGGTALLRWRSRAWESARSARMAAPHGNAAKEGWLEILEGTRAAGVRGCAVRRGAGNPDHLLA
jgi:hypothetical protein